MLPKKNGLSHTRNPKVLLVPDDSLYIAFRLLPILHHAGFDVDILCLRNNPIAHSRYAAQVIQHPTAESRFDFLGGILRQPQRPWRTVIVADEDIVHELLATRDPRLLKNWQPAAVDSIIHGFLSGKFGLEEARLRWKLSIPPGRACFDRDDVLDFGREIGWPIIVKPPGGSGGKGVIKFESPDTVELFQRDIRYPVLAQQFIYGRLGVTEMLCAEGRPLACLDSYVCKTTNGPFGPSTARCFEPVPALKPLTEQIAQLTRFEGFCGFDWIEEESTGRHYLIDFHPRASYGFRFGRFCGVDFSKAASAWLHKETAGFASHVQPHGRNVLAPAFTADFFRCLRERDWQGLKAWLPGSGARHDIYWDDLPLFLAWAASRLQAIFQPQPLLREQPLHTTPSPRQSGEREKGRGVCPLNPSSPQPSPPLPAEEREKTQVAQLPL